MHLIPLAFLGLGVYRAWIEITFVSSFVNFRRFRSRATYSILGCRRRDGAVVLLARRDGAAVREALAVRVVRRAGAADGAVVRLVFRAGLAGSLGVVTSVAGGGAGLILIWSELWLVFEPIADALLCGVARRRRAYLLYIVEDAVVVRHDGALACRVACERMQGFAKCFARGRAPAKRRRVSIGAVEAIILLMAFFFAFRTVSSRQTPTRAISSGPHSSPGTFAVSGGAARRAC